MDIEFIRQEAAAEAIKKADDLATNQLVSMAVLRLFFTPREKNEFPISDLI